MVQKWGKIEKLTWGKICVQPIYLTLNGTSQDRKPNSFNRFITNTNINVVDPFKKMSYDYISLFFFFQDEVEEVKKQKTENGANGANGKAAVDLTEENGAEDDDVEEEEDIDEEDEENLDGEEEEGEEGEEDLDEAEGEEGEGDEGNALCGEI